MSDAEEPVVEEPGEEPAEEPAAEENEDASEMESAVAERGAAVARLLQNLETAVRRAEEAGFCAICMTPKVSLVTAVDKNNAQHSQT